MSIRTARYAVMLSLGISLACARTPAAPTPFQIPIPQPEPQPPSEPPQAVLSISPGPAAGPLGVEAYTPFVFDGAASTGGGLTYRIEFGDGASADTEVATHVVGTFGQHTARLTVTDRLGRSSTVEQKYFLARVQCSGNGHWQGHDGERRAGVRVVSIRFGRRTDPSSLSGWLDMTQDGLDEVPVVGTLVNDRDMSLRTADGAIEMFGRLQWKDESDMNFSQSRVEMLLTIRGGPADGASILMSWYDGYC